ncbi:MAG: iron-sulfur cluster assembly accessory protein [Ignavibacteria bacterium]|jgi:iron-sulfur cluster assembly protein|nr:iron-sulfur cluster assembly accessory protein [Ignavibacteria bacterium]MBP9096699.1 iron-sulfur cluster assembly accessory protein [Ignavibacteria bacterium]
MAETIEVKPEFIPGVSEEINITDKAIAEVKKIMEENSIPGEYGLRVGIKGGGCSGLTYTLGFDGEERPGDNIIEKDGVKVYIDMKSNLYLSGTELDFTDGLNGRGFVFNNPNAKRTCGCGSSFGV